eukprot:gnl/TRDRNA2_/TRDRNA2_43516_c0_seq1.p1 gnl/TRDRNA2_/TRDRNA2_43516_c0~~gnl/TRDRNA2_/TRDRNA2_43516_c0_seq1.p1  ORF type:complete len:457 (-),score=21.25 gnl/TRDRNA2_/TRDRNA2_43516_c0_seq1:16-1386(-)
MFAMIARSSLHMALMVLMVVVWSSPFLVHGIRVFEWSQQTPLYYATPNSAFSCPGCNSTNAHRVQGQFLMKWDGECHPPGSATQPDLCCGINPPTTCGGCPGNTCTVSSGSPAPPPPAASNSWETALVNVVSALSGAPIDSIDVTLPVPPPIGTVSWTIYVPATVQGQQLSTISHSYVTNVQARRSSASQIFNYYEYVPSGSAKGYLIPAGNVVVTHSPSVQDDPEVVNAKGEKFKINGRGSLTLLHLPRDKRVSEASLVMIAELSELTNEMHQTGNSCTPTFIRNLLITGTWLGELKAVLLHARNNTSPFIIGFGNPAHFLEDGRITPASIRRHTQMLAASRTNASIHITPDEEFRGRVKAIYFELGPVTIKVVRPHRIEGKNWQYLNVEVSGLDSINFRLSDIGGVMGLDSPHIKATSTSTCLNSRKKLIPRNDSNRISLREVHFGIDADDDEA